MIRPYVAVVLDSFHSAFSSRILWIALLAIWILLACLAPIGFREDYTTAFRSRDFENGTRLKAMLASSLADPTSQSAAVSRIVAATPDELKRELERVGAGDEVRIHLQVLADALNGLLDRQDWYDEAAWSGTTRLRERRELEAIPTDKLSESQSRRLARLRIEAALPGVFETRSSRSIILTYAGLDFPANFEIDKTQFTTLINQWVLPTLINWLLGFIVIFLGILVTASIIPEMLEPGSLHLLLSKPVSRSMLLLSKFLGGCVFVFLCVTQLVLGLWVIAGTRLDVWNGRLLWCIPVCVFLFAVFYSVSAVAGLRWRSPILAIGITCIFGAICLTSGIIGGLFDSLVSGPSRLRHVATVGDEFVASTYGGGLVRYDAATNQWSEIFESNTFGGDRALAPIALPTGEFLTAQVKGGRFNPFGSGSLDLLVLSAENNWDPVPSLRLPTATVKLLGLPPGRLLAVNAGGITSTDVAKALRAAGMSPAESESDDGAETNATEGEMPSWIAKLAGMMGGATEGFEPILPKSITLAPPRSLAVDPANDALFLVSGTRLYRLRENDQSGAGWSVEQQVELSGEPVPATVLAANEKHLAIARSGQPVQIFDKRTLARLHSLDMPRGATPVAMIAIGNLPLFALLTGEGQYHWLHPKSSAAGDDSAVWGLSTASAHGDVEAIGFDAASGQMLVAHRVDQLDVLRVEMGDGERNPVKLATLRRIDPSLSKWRWVERYVVTPLRTIIPQTGELGETVAAIVSGQSSVVIDEAGPNDEPQIVRYKLVRPVASCAAFIVVMLTIGCVYFSTRDF